MRLLRMNQRNPISNGANEVGQRFFFFFFLLSSKRLIRLLFSFAHEITPSHLFQVAFTALLHQPLAAMSGK